MEQSRVSGKQVPSLTAVRRISPVQSPQLSPRGSDVKAQSILESSGKSDNPKALLLPSKERKESEAPKKAKPDKKGEKKPEAPKVEEQAKRNEGPKAPAVVAAAVPGKASRKEESVKQKTASRREVKPD